MSETSTEVERTQLAVEPLPQPSCAPIAMSLGVMMLAWGILSHWLMSLFGIGVIAGSLWMWMNQVCQLWRTLDDNEE